MRVETLMVKDLNLDLSRSIERLSKRIGKRFSGRRIGLIRLTRLTQTHRHQGKGKNMATNNGNKNAYEIRLEVLQSAIELADSAHYQRLDKVRHEAGEKGTYELPEDTRVKDALRIAKKLYTFVEAANDEQSAE
jgi:hypothetical protein